MSPSARSPGVNVGHATEGRSNAPVVMSVRSTVASQLEHEQRAGVVGSDRAAHVAVDDGERRWQHLADRPQDGLADARGQRGPPRSEPIFPVESNLHRAVCCDVHAQSICCGQAHGRSLSNTGTDRVTWSLCDDARSRGAPWRHGAISPASFDHSRNTELRGEGASVPLASESYSPVKENSACQGSSELTTSQ